MTQSIKMIEIFAGIGAQEKALRQLPINCEIVATMDVEKDAILSYATMRNDFEKEFNNYKFPSKETMVSELQKKNVGFDFVKSKHTITMRTNEKKVKQYYLADKLARNLGDVSLCESLPYADIVFHSSPCQSFSVAGKGAGGDEGSGTTSSLMWESLRLIKTSKPKYIIWENVAAVLSGKHKHNFIKYLEKLTEMGYESTFDLLNSKNYGVPQNRLRIFCISHKINNKYSGVKNSHTSTNKKVQEIMTEIASNNNIKIWDSFTWPEQIPLTTRLKDILEKNVDEKYYLSGDKVESILANFIARQNEASGINLKDQATTFDGLTDVAHTLMARDYKGFGNQSMTGVIEPSIIKVGQLDSSFDQSGRVYSAEGIAPTVMSNSHGKTSGGYTSPKILVDEEPFIVASRGRNPENPSDRTTGSPTEQRLEANTNGTTNTITTVAKDNYVMEPVVCEQRCDEGLRFFKDDVVGTLRTIDACGDKRVIEPEEINPELVGGIGEKNFGKQYRQGNRVYSSESIAMCLNSQPVGNAGGNSYLYAVKEDDVNPVRIGNIYGEQFGTGYAGNVWDQDSVSPTIMTAQGGNRQPLVVDNVKWRIRKLTPKECWRLMNFSDEDCNRASKYVSDSALYKQAGNSIVTSCLVAIFYSLLFNDSSTKWSDYIVQHKINGGNNESTRAFCWNEKYW